MRNSECTVSVQWVYTRFVWIIIIIFIIIIIDIITSFMQGIYTYIPKTNHVPKEYSVSGIVSFLFIIIIIIIIIIGYFLY